MTPRRPAMGRTARAALGIALAAMPLEAQRVRLGYTPATSQAQGALERRLQALVSASSISALHGPLARRPHPAGTPASREVVRYLERTLRAFGLDVERHEYRAWLSHPRSVRVTMTAPTPRTLSVLEPPMARDPSSRHAELGEGHIAYSASGDVEGRVVYANYGLPADYAELARLGVGVRGRIVLARYGRSHRAVKVHTAQEAGALGIVLYSDPADDGFVRGAPWPDGYWRGEQMLQRGNAKMSWFFHGDPLTPGIAATANATRLDPARAPTLPRIPAVAISWGEARHLLAALGGVAAPPAFRGGIPVTYRTGPGAAAVRLRVRMDDGLKPIHNVVATLRGRTQPDRMVLLGGHHDAWTFGGVDPGTGTAALLEVGRVLGRLARGGWRPERTIALAFWDAEEFGLIGSTEHAEHFRERLQEQLLLYVNTDMYMLGRFDPGGVPSLRDFVVDVARDVAGDTEGRTVYDRWVSDTTRRPRPAPGGPELKALGSGADFVPFQDFLAVPTLSVEFIGANGYGFGTYHTNYDSRAYVERIADPGFRQGVVMARVLATMALRMANAELLPFRFTHYAEKLGDAVRVARSGLRDGGQGRGIPPGHGMEQRAERVLAEARALDVALDSRAASSALPAADRRRLNDLLARAEQRLADDRGATDRSWYRHVVHGWNIYSLYDGQPFPGLAEALRTGDVGRTTTEVARIEGALDRLARSLGDARLILEGARP